MQVEAGSAVGFDLPAHLLERFDDETSWVLCLRSVSQQAQ